MTATNRGTDVAVTESLPAPVESETSPAVSAVTTSDALRLLRQAVVELDRLCDLYEGDATATGTAAIYVDALLRDLRALHARLRTVTATAMEGRHLMIPGVGQLERVRDGRDVWDDRRTLAAVIAYLIDSGEVTHPTDLPDGLLRFASIGYWRKGALTEAGIDFRDARDTDGSPIEGSGLCQTVKGDPSVRVVVSHVNR
jgi:hypothetical protein